MMVVGLVCAVVIGSTELSWAFFFLTHNVDSESEIPLG